MAEVGHNSVLDLSFTSLRESMVWECKRSFVGGSHHCPIVADVSDIAKSPLFFVSKKLFQKKVCEIGSIQSINDIVVAIGRAREEATFDLNNFKHTPKAWWCEELARQYRLLNTARSKARRTGRREDLEHAYLLLEEWKKAVKKAKNENFFEAVESLNANPNTKKAWCFINNVKNCNKSGETHWCAEDNDEYLDYLRQQISIPNSPGLDVMMDALGSGTEPPLGPLDGLTGRLEQLI